MKTAALIGISGYARHHLLMALEQALHGRLRLAAATIINPSEEAFFCHRLRQLGCEVFERTDAMWEKYAGRIDLCFIPTGIHLHASMALEALRAGANVLVEKPLATSTADALKIMQQERAHDRFVAVGFQDLYTESTWTIKRRLRDGEIGTVKTISFAGLWPRPAEYYARNDWAGRLRHNGRLVLDSPVNNAFAHFFNLALFWAGPTLETSARATGVECELYRAQRIESFDTCCVRAALSGGAQLLACATHSCEEERVPTVRIEGTRGRIEWTQESHYEVVDHRGARQRFPVPGKFETKLMMADAVVARCDDRAARVCDTGIALEHVRLVEAMHAASPIVEVPSDLVHGTRNSTGQWRAIRGIEHAIDRALARAQVNGDFLPAPEPANGNGHADVGFHFFQTISSP